ncbi:MAG: hypothetical protein BZ136_08570 [Methanosphaera sp. rholeuAM74]|nr:MAG: hypothetical protein BZ136_08570 [Methanosphaera sp. rholeuAM74]
MNLKFLACFLIVSLLSLSAVYAVSDESVDTTQYESYDVHESPKTATSTDIQQVTDYDGFKDAAKQGSSADNYIIELVGDKNYVESDSSTYFFYDVGSEDRQHTTVTIKGNNHVIDLNTSVCHLNAVTNSSLIVKDLTIVNGYFGVICFEGCSFTAYNCNFISNNMSTSNEGDMKFVNCTFVNNSHTTNSLLDNYYYLATLAVTNCSFESNHMRLLDNGGSAVLDNSVFKNNTFTDSSKPKDNFTIGKRDLIHSGPLSSTHITSCDFNLANDGNYNFINSTGMLSIDCSAFNGGVYNELILCTGTLNITKTEFRNVRVNKTLIDVVGSPYEYDYIMDNIFSNNSGSIGTILFVNNSKVHLDRNVITHNTASKYGVIFNHGKLVCYNNTYTHNHARWGGVTYNTKVLRITKDVYKNNYAASYAGAIYNDNDTIMQSTEIAYSSSPWAAAAYNSMDATFTITRSYIHDNNAFSVEEDGYEVTLSNGNPPRIAILAFDGVSAIDNDGVMNISYTRINSNNATRAGAIHNTGLLTLYHCAVKNNTAEVASAVFSAPSFDIDPKIVINDSVITNNYAGIDCTIYSDIGCNISVTSSAIKNMDDRESIIIYYDNFSAYDSVIMNTRYPDRPAIIRISVDRSET